MLSDSDLVALAKKGDMSAIEAVYERWRPLIAKVTRRHYDASLLTLDEAMSAAHQGFFDAIRTYDKESGEWHKWLAWKVYFAVKRQLQRAAKLKSREIPNGLMHEEDCSEI